MIIVSGRIIVAPGDREAFLSASLEAVRMARVAPGCRDFVVAPDPIEPGRVNVYEAWDSEAELEAFRGSGPSDEMSVAILSAEVARHQIASSGPA